ncbi:DNA-binding protein [Rudaea cellulosilytica]|uniref:DNA-binding protein n=1 Tax=Rudaea cellulosilytica TaxID=540746 RepID=UPI00036A11C9|nr:DNA-binding protein [Rudaea cellulosilytica]
MARGVTQDQVTRAADALLARGERPTIEKVRAELGTGSPNTLLRLLDVWWAELAGRLAAQARAQLPSIPDAVQRAMMTLWSEAVVVTRQEAETRLEERERGLQERETALQAQLEQATAQETAQQETLILVRHECEAAKADLVNERRRIDDLQQSLAAALRSLTEAQATVAALRLAGEEAQKAFRVDRERAEATEQRWLREVDRAREEAKSAQQDARAAYTKVASETKRRVKLEEDLAHQKRIMKQRLAELERQQKSRKKSKNSASRKPG